MRPSTLALEGCGGDATRIDGVLIERVLEASRGSARRRMILPFHRGDSDTLQRMLNAVQPGSYIRPHRHGEPPKAESLVVLRGGICVVLFGEGGEIARLLFAGGESGCAGIDLGPGIDHCFLATEPDTVLFEVKPGPYDAATDKQFAPWAPEEGSPEAPAYLRALEEAVARAVAGG